MVSISDVVVIRSLKPSEPIGAKSVMPNEFDWLFTLPPDCSKPLYVLISPFSVALDSFTAFSFA